MTGKIIAVLGSITFILPVFAYAGSLDAIIALQTSIPEITKFNNLILNDLAMAIPAALGGGALFLIGRDFYMASQKSIAESLLTAKMIGFLFGKMGGGKTPPPNPLPPKTAAAAMPIPTGKSSSSDEKVRMTESLKTGSGAVTKTFIREEEEEEKKSF